MVGVFFGRSPLRWWLRFSFAGRGRCRWLFRRRWPGPACLNHSRESPSRRIRASQERNGEFFGEERDDRTPHARGLRIEVQQDYRRAMSGGEGADGLVSCSGGRQGRASKRIAREFQRLLVAGGTIDGLYRLSPREKLIWLRRVLVKRRVQLFFRTVHRALCGKERLIKRLC
jgi:hypothetical protein